MSFFPRVIFSLIDPENRKTSCRTTPILRLSAWRSYSAISMPSIQIDPAYEAILNEQDEEYWHDVDHGWEDAWYDSDW